MGWSSFTTTKLCAYCNQPFETRNVRGSDLCPIDQQQQFDIDAIRGTTPYNQMTPEMKLRVADRIEKNGITKRVGGFNWKTTKGNYGR